MTKFYCKKLILEDQFEEEAYRFLMEAYMEEGKFDKAIEVYTHLIGKYPEKSSYFANQIAAIKDLLKSWGNGSNFKINW